MYVFKRIRLRVTGRLAAACAALVTMIVLTSSAAMATEVPPSGGGGEVVQQAVAPVAGGMPGWQITLIAVGAALVAAALAVLADRARSARRQPTAEPTAATAGKVPPRVSGVR